MAPRSWAPAALAAIGLLILACSGPGFGRPPATAPQGGGVELPPVWTHTPSSTSPPPSPVPSATPPFGLALATPVAVDREFEGWVRLEAERVGLWLPPGFEAVDLGEFGDFLALMTYAMTEAMGQMIQAFASPAPGQPLPTLVSLEELEQAFLFDFVAAASQDEQAALFLVGEPPTDQTDLGEAVESALGGFEGEVQVEEKHAVVDPPWPTARLVLTVVDSETGAVLRHLLYVRILEARVWQIDYAAPADRFDSLLPAFEKSAASFEVFAAIDP